MRDKQLNHLLEEKGKITCDVLGLCETRRKQSLEVIWKDGTFIKLGRGEGARAVGGIGFVVSKEFSSKIISCEIKSPRLGILYLSISGKKTLKIVQAYAPTSNSEDEELEEFYKELEDSLSQKSTYTVVMGDLKAKIGRGRADENYIGRYGIGKRNERGERLATFAETKKLYVGNSWFRKKAKRRWTWIAPNARKKNEIDYLLINTKRILRDVAVVPSFNTGSDHRLIRAKLHFDMKVEKKALQEASKKRRLIKFDKTLLSECISKEDWSIKEDYDEDYAQFVEKLRRCLEKARKGRRKEEKGRISKETSELLERRKKMKREGKNNIEYSLLCRLIRRKLKEDFEKYRTNKLLNAAINRKSIKTCKRELTLYRSAVTALKNKNGETITERRGMEDICKEFYTELFASKIDIPMPQLQESDEKLPPVLISEVRNAVFQMKEGKAPGKDGLTIEAIKAGGYVLWKALAERFSRYFEMQKIPKSWKESETILLHKKGEYEDLKNYRPICLLSHVYKLFTKIITNRLQNSLDEQQPREQAGFRRNYSTIDHIFTLTQLLEKSREYRFPLCIAFVDYQKAFDSVEFNAVMSSLYEQGINTNYIKLLKEANSGCTTDITLFDTPIRIPVTKGVKQGDTISPKLFTACLETVFRKLSWKSGIDVNGEQLNHLRFADDVVLIANNTRKLQKMLRELDAESRKVGLKLNRSKTKYMRSRDLKKEKITINGEEIEEVNKYVYLGQEVNMRNDLDGEISRRKKAGWCSFMSAKDILQGSISMKVRANLFSSMVMPAMLYGSETWSLTKAEENSLSVTQRAMERRMLGISIRDRIPNEVLRERSGLHDIVVESRRRKMQWAGHVARMHDGRWTEVVSEWYPRELKRPLGRPPIRWEDFVSKRAGRNWRRTARERELWTACCDRHALQDRG